MDNHARFGSRVAEHDGLFSAGGMLWYIGPICAAAGVYQVGKGVLDAVAMGDTAPLGMAAIGLVFALFGLGAIAVSVLRWKQKVIVYQRGLVHQHLLGPRELDFAEVARTELVRTRSRHGTTEDLHVHLRNGGEVTIGGVDQIEQLVSMIHSGRNAATAA